MDFDCQARQHVRGFPHLMMPSRYSPSLRSVWLRWYHPGGDGVGASSLRHAILIGLQDHELYLYMYFGRFVVHPDGDSHLHNLVLQLYQDPIYMEYTYQYTGQRRPSSMLEDFWPNRSELIKLGDGDYAVGVGPLHDVTTDVLRLPPFDGHQATFAEMHAVSPSELSRGFDVRETVIDEIKLLGVGYVRDLRGLHVTAVSMARP